MFKYRRITARLLVFFIFITIFQVSAISHLNTAFLPILGSNISPLSVEANEQTIEFIPGAPEEANYLDNTTNLSHTGGNVRYVSLNESFVYKFDLPDTVNVAGITLRMALEYCVYASKDGDHYEKVAQALRRNCDNNRWTDVTLRLSRFLVDNPDKKLYFKFTDPTTGDGFGTQISRATLNYNTDGTAATASDLAKDPVFFLPAVGATAVLDTGFIVSSNEETPYLVSDYNTTPLNVYGTPGRNIVGSSYIIYKFKVDPSSTDVQLESCIGNLYKIEVSQNGISNWETVASDASTVNLSNFYAHKADVTSKMNPEHEIYVKLSSANPGVTNNGCYVQYIGLKYTFTYDGTNIQIPTDKIEFIPDTAEESKYLDNTANFSHVGGNVRFVYPNESFVYKFDLPDTVNVANITLRMALEYCVYASKDGDHYEKVAQALRRNCDNNRWTNLTLRLSRFLVDNPDKKLYFKFTDPTKGDGFGTQISRVTLNYNADGTAATASDLAKDPIFFLPAVGETATLDTGCIASSDEETPYLVSDYNTTPLNVYGTPGRNIVGNSYIIYKFKVDPSSTDVQLESCIGNLYKIEVSQNGISNWETVASDASTVNLSNFYAHKADVTSKMNSEHEIYVKLSSANPGVTDNGCYVQYIGLKYKFTYNGTNIQIPSDKIEFIPDTAEESKYLDNTANFSHVGGNVRFVYPNESFVYKFDLPDTVNVSNITLRVALEYCVYVSKNGDRYEKVAQALRRNCDNNRWTNLTLKLSRFLVDNPDKKLYIKFTDPTTGDGFGTQISKVTLNYYEDGTAATAIDLAKDPIFLLPAVGETAVLDTGFIASSDEEIPYMVSDYGSTQLNLYGTPGRMIARDSYIIYKFKVDPSSTNVQLESCIGNLYKIEVSQDGFSNWETVASDASTVNLSNFYAHKVDVTSKMNSEHEIYVKLSSANPSVTDNGCYVQYIGLKYTFTYDGTNIQIPVDDTGGAAFSAVNTEYNIAIEAQKGALPSGITALRIGADTSEGGSVYDAISEKIDKDTYREFSVYIINIYDQKQNTIFPKSPLNVMMTLPLSISSSPFEVYFYDMANGTLKKTSASLSGQNLTFDTAHFGYFVFAVKNEPPDMFNGYGYDNGNPDTGTRSAVVLSIVILLLCFAAILIALRRKSLY